MLISNGDPILQQGNHPTAFSDEIAKAARFYARQCGKTKPAIPQKEPHLQQQLTRELQEAHRAQFFASLSPAEKERLVSLQSPHATTWL